ncbi:FASCICLIN-LIKE ARABINOGALACTAN PROTEIN [Salix purpurea]|uniref:FASCICLIN-LIKE ARABINOGALACTAN PROTEIN n=1 Tax=Salix purpurea TaxID=77065 RepID=A0A9Q0TKD3_SALPP|nr:FASCICLIN-LIKE ARABINOGALACTAN PROTEIN [Salix purpurea]
MSLRFSPVFALCFSLLLFFNTARAFNITQILSQYSDFKTFSSYLTETQLAGEINSRQTITVLVVEDGNMSPLSGKPKDEIKNVLSGHVILDYYDVAKLQKLQNKTAMLTTLFQSSGQAVGQQGFLNVTVSEHELSCVWVSNIIVPAGTGKTNSTTSPVTVGSPKTSPTSPASSPEKPPSSSNPPPSKAPAPSTAKPPPTNAPAPSMVKPPAANAPSATPPAMSTSPVEGPSPATADGPSADSPTLSPPAMDGPVAATPAADGPLADAPSDPKSDASVINPGNNLASFAPILLLAFALA